MNEFQQTYQINKLEEKMQKDKSSSNKNTKITKLQNYKNTKSQKYNIGTQFMAISRLQRFKRWLWREVIYLSCCAQMRPVENLSLYFLMMSLVSLDLFWPLELLVCSIYFYFHCKKRMSSNNILTPFNAKGGTRDYIVVGSDSGRIVVLQFDPDRMTFIKLLEETYGKSGCRRIVPGQYLAVDPKGRAIMIGAIEKQKLVYVLNRKDFILFCFVLLCFLFLFLLPCFVCLLL
jgi:hypothetical protein